MYKPSSTYRIQFNNQFTFRKLEKIIPYLKSLGVSCIYASPVFEATPGSNHGYDVTNPLYINPEIGQFNDLVRLIGLLNKEKIRWIQDIVPNHMAFHPRNGWLMDVLKNGLNSCYSGFFDIDWNHPDFRNKIMVPFLGKPLTECIKEGEIQLINHSDQFFLNYIDYTFPVNDETIDYLKKNFKQQDSENICQFANNDPEILRTIISFQHYVLAYWKETSSHINYRRFFSINNLIGLRMDDDIVFEKYHELIFRLTDDGMFSGLRIDHIDGLKWPANYVEKLRSRIGPEKYIVVEKILSHHEKLDPNWPVQGTTGYDFLAIVNNLLTNTSAMPQLKGFYREINGSGSEIQELSAEDFMVFSKNQMLYESFQGDLDNICRMMTESGLIAFSQDVTPETIKEAVGQFLILCPVYRLYSEHIPLYAQEEAVIRQILIKAGERRPSLKNSLKVLGDIFTHPYPEKQEVAAAIFAKMMQFTGPLMAKGVEDTTMYAWTSFIAHNEVGDAVNARGLNFPEFHRIMESRRKCYPNSMNATSSHDTKRGEDIRARLNIISDIPDEWVRFIRDCTGWNTYRKKYIRGKSVPDASEEYFIYQTLLGVIPFDLKIDKILLSRLNDYFVKSLREAKTNSGWDQPDLEYEKAVVDFAYEVLADNNFMKNLFIPFFKRLKHFGVVNSLAQVILKCTCPGIPDFYQGTELWDLNLVDPDNRRPVNYDHSKHLHDQMNELQFPLSHMHQLLKWINDGSLKLRITKILMKERNENPVFWVDAEYMPLSVHGEFKEYILAFARRKGTLWYLIIIPLHMAEICRSDASKKLIWKNTRIELPPHAPVEWTMLWDGSLMLYSGEITLDRVLHLNIPVVLKGIKPEQQRAAGVLLHLTSLPGKFGTGNLGDTAYEFVDFLRTSGQKYWQILPFNAMGDSESPYSSCSAFAGNTLLIDPDQMYAQRYLMHKKLPTVKQVDACDFRKSRKITEMAIQQSYDNFNLYGRYADKRNFEKFLHENAFWINDYILFALLKRNFRNTTWNQWPSEFKNRNKKVLYQFKNDNKYEFRLQEFAQYLFHKQFSELRKYANSFGIGLIGDVPVYVGYDSADVWSHPEFFDLDSEGNMLHVAGVPPDIFSKTGQLWNMPVYNWNNMKKDRYRWWKRRISKNLEYCSILRLDHFRGFSAFWSVPAKEKTAKNGEWIKGPGHDFFCEMKKEYPDMPFIAEDLGEIDEEVYRLRDDFSLPGMNILQFAFDEQMPWSVHAVHNHNKNSVVYTGTHDNNTSKGWFIENADRSVRMRLSNYTGRKVTKDSVAWEMIRLAYSSVSQIAVIPLQDILGLDSAARLNTPSSKKGNWQWKLVPGFANHDLAERLCHLAAMYGRI